VGTQRAHLDGAEMFLRLVLLDVIGKCELSAADSGFLSNPSAVPDRPTQPACAGAPKARQKTARSMPALSRAQSSEHLLKRYELISYPRVRATVTNRAPVEGGTATGAASEMERRLR
jgi:hypothetical protein